MREETILRVNDTLTIVRAKGTSEEASFTKEIPFDSGFPLFLCDKSTMGCSRHEIPPPGQATEKSFGQDEHSKVVFPHESLLL